MAYEVYTISENGCFKTRITFMNHPKTDFERIERAFVTNKPMA